MYDFRNGRAPNQMAHERKEKSTLTKSHDIGSHVSESMILSLIYQMK